MTESNTMTVGCDLGDRYSHLCVLDEAGEVVERTRIRTTRHGFERWLGGRAAMRIAVETGTHARWVSELLAEQGHEVFVANAREVRLVSGGRRKNDRLDAEKLARLARVDPHLLHPVQLRSRQAQADRAMLQARDQLVQARTKLINSVQGIVKSFGERVSSGGADSFHRRAFEAVPQELQQSLQPMLETIEKLTHQIRRYDKLLGNKLQQYPQAQVLMQVPGVGPITALAFLVTIEDPERFARSREVGPFLGLVPRHWQSGDHDPELGISKAGDPYVRRLLVQCAHYILGPFAGDSDLRRHGQRIIARAGSTPRRSKKRTAPKKRAAVAVARKLAVLLHRLWVTGEVYEPLRNAQPMGEAA